MSIWEPSSLYVTTPLGDGYVLVVELDEHDNWWTVALDTGVVVTFPQDKIRIARSYTHGRGISDEEMRRIIETSPDQRARTVRRPVLSKDAGPRWHLQNY